MYISTVVNQFFPKSPILAESANIIAESANIKVNTSHPLLFNPQCDHISSSLTHQSAQRSREDSYTNIIKVFHSSNPASMNPSNIIIQSSIAEPTNIYIDLYMYPSSIPSAPIRLMSIPSFHVGAFQFPDTSKANHLSSFQFPVQYAIENSYSQFSVSLLNIGATPDVDPEPPPWNTFLCMVSVILVRFRIYLWGSNSMGNSMSALFLEFSFTHELVCYS